MLWCAPNREPHYRGFSKSLSAAAARAVAARPRPQMPMFRPPRHPSGKHTCWTASVNQFSSWCAPARCRSRQFELRAPGCATPWGRTPSSHASCGVSSTTRRMDLATTFGGWVSHERWPRDDPSAPTACTAESSDAQPPNTPLSHSLLAATYTLQASV